MLMSENSSVAWLIPSRIECQYPPSVEAGMVTAILNPFLRPTAEVCMLFLYPDSASTFSTAALERSDTFPLRWSILSTVPADTPASFAISVMVSCFAINPA